MMKLPYLISGLMALGLAFPGAASGGAVQTSSNSTDLNLKSITSDRPQLLAQRMVNNCRSGESMFLAIETKNFWVNICGGDNPYTYVGMDKRSRKSIRLPLRDYDPQGTYFEAVNGNVTYILAQTPKGKFLTVTRGTRELLRERTLSGW
jgi:hypothetical protein